MSETKTSRNIGQECSVFPLQAGLAVMTTGPNTSHLYPEHKVYPYLARGFSYLVLAPGAQLADQQQYENDMLCCCHEGHRSQWFSR